jgi:signal transduction histidine kinase
MCSARRASRQTNLPAHLQAVVDELRDTNLSRTVWRDIALVSPVRADLNRMQQLLSNLLGNALAHGAPDSPIQVQVTSDAEYFVISVTNRGNPIPAHLLPKVFEPYWRSSASIAGGRLGLGLFICKQIVEAHAGKIEACSTPRARNPIYRAYLVEIGAVGMPMRFPGRK